MADFHYEHFLYISLKCGHGWEGNIQSTRFEKNTEENDEYAVW